VREPDRVRKAIGIVFQDPALDDQLTAYENMYIHGLLYGMKGEELESRIDELLEFVELKPFRDKQVKTFSGGMRRRLEMARALLHKPAVLFLDEPTIGLDPQSRAKIWDYIEKMRSEHEVTVFLTTHYMDEAEKLADRIAIIDHGRIVAEGTPEQLKSIVGEDVVYVELGGLHGQGGDPCRYFGRLEEVKGCTAVRQGMIALKVADASRSIPKVLDAAARGSLVVKSVSYKRPTLNDVFLYLTGRELRDEGISPSDYMKMVMRLRRRWSR
jgi:ABC-2 type transport system ATP-binding protein